MKKVILGLILFLLFIPLSVNAFGVFHKTITVNFNHEGCEIDANKKVIIQLFADGEKVEDGEQELNKANNYTYVYEDLEVFHSNTNKEIKYEVKILENGIYRMIDSANYSYSKKHVNKWVQVLPEDIKPGHTYIITGENTLYQTNDLPQVIYLRGDVKAEEAVIVNDYVFINGKPSYYSLNEEPRENTEWRVQAVPTTDPDYDEFKDYLMFVNEKGKMLTLSGYIQDDESVNFLFKYSGKNGFITDENALYTNKVQIVPSENSRGKFYITSKNLFEAPLDKYNRTEYLAVSNSNKYYATSHKSLAGLFKAYEYIEADVQVAVDVTVKETMCSTDSVVLNKESEVKRNIKLNLDCSQCESKKDEGVTLQLFADGKKVKNEEIKLNSKTGFEYTYEDLPVFHDGSDTQINYEVKALLNGNYYTLPQKNVSYKTEQISKWVQVFPADIKPGHTYILTTNNREYETQGGSRFVYLRGDVKAEEAPVVQEYNIIDGKEYFYVLNDEPAENTLWEVTEVPTDDPDYAAFKDYLMFVNEKGKKLTLTGTVGSNGINFIYKYSGKSGYVADEDALYTNKVMVIPANDQYGSFYIASRNLFDEPNNMIQYIKLNSSNHYQATEKLTSAAKFKAFEYVEKETMVAGEMIITPSLCEVLELANNVNPNTGSKIIAIMSLMFVSGAVIFALTNQRKKTLINKAR